MESQRKARMGMYKTLASEGLSLLWFLSEVLCGIPGHYWIAKLVQRKVLHTVWLAIKLPDVFAVVHDNSQGLMKTLSLYFEISNLIHVPFFSNLAFV